MMRRGRFIVIEGLEGAGKSSALQTIKQYLEPVIPKILYTREPGGTRVGELVRSMIKEKVPEQPMDPRAELLLLYAARVQLIETVIRPALNAGTWVISDRFELSSFAYQGGGRGLDKQMIAHLSSFCIKNIQPDLILFLDISPEQGLERVHKRGKTDRIEQESLSFFREVCQGYHDHIKTMSNVVCLDASQPMHLVQESILIQVKAFLSNEHGF
jgi:dTMP kinase